MRNHAVKKKKKKKEKSWVSCTMVHQSTAPASPDAAAPTYPEIQGLELFSRSPHPYHRHQGQPCSTTPGPSLPSTPQSASPLRSSSSSSSSSHTRSDDSRKRRKILSPSPSESGTEADDEGFRLSRALPAPPLRLHKGLRDPDGPGPEEWVSALVTPTQLDHHHEERKLPADLLCEKDGARSGAHHGTTPPAQEEARVAREKYAKRRRMELLRRTTETAELVAIGVLAVRGCGEWNALRDRHRELLAHACVMGGLLGLYPLRILYYSWRRGSKWRLQRRIRLPASFDPATILYPPLLPAILSLSLFHASPKFLLPNLVLGLAALPARLLPFREATVGYSTLHWLLSMLPLMAAKPTDMPSQLLAPNPHKLTRRSHHKGLDPSLMVLLFPLHQALLPPLYYLTTTSLLPAELHLLSIGLINLLLFAESPQATILKTLLWMGGLGLLILCRNVLEWGVALARIPRWRLRRTGQAVRARMPFLQTLHPSLANRRKNSSQKGNDSDADEDGPVFQAVQKSKRRKGRAVDSVSKEVEEDDVQPSPRHKVGIHPRRKRSNTLPMLTTHDSSTPHGYGQRKRSKSMTPSFLSLTPTQAACRKWTYAGYFYLVVVLLILGPIRYWVGRDALHQHEPFGWALGYLLGDITSLRWQAFNWGLSSWIPLPALPAASPSSPVPPLSTAEQMRTRVGQANTRLVLSAYCLVTILAGLGTVLSLPAIVQVDTRRKVFHGTMVAMLLPTTFIDPCFVALALALVLAVFLLLDLVRASQLPPLSKPIARFLTPYVDGRDLRGPVVVSHIFLLVGCAVPLWLGLAGSGRTGAMPWTGWDVAERDVGMVAGVVCVGMGDAAASLVGRRWGRHKWPWVGGKSLEGSAAFGLAVWMGLMAGKMWLRTGWAGQEEVGQQHPGAGVWWREGLAMMGKALVCGLGASLNEAVLTGGNDNVIVPVVLWVLVRGVGL